MERLGTESHDDSRSAPYRYRYQPLPNHVGASRMNLIHFLVFQPRPYLALEKMRAPLPARLGFHKPVLPCAAVNHRNGVPVQWSRTDTFALGRD